MKKIWIGTSWKMNKDSVSAERWVSSISGAVRDCSDKIEPFVIPPFPYIAEVSRRLSGEKIRVGAQNMCWEEQGAFTGEVSPLMLKDCGASLVEIGHSERRTLFGETDHTVNLKVRSALKNGLTPLVCVGDTLHEKEWGVSGESVVRQVKIALFQVAKGDAEKVIFAYEPVWAIGEKGTPATPEEAGLRHKAIRDALGQIYGDDVAREGVILYGGSVNLGNAEALLAQPDIDGLFVGRTAWDAEGYVRLLSIAQQKSGS